MKVRRFTAATMQKALKKVSEEMGPDAVILSNHRVAGGVEIIVAQNYEPVSARQFDTANQMQQSEQNQVSAKSDFVPVKPVQVQPKNPWPFLSDEQQKQVKEQLVLQDQLEQLKKIRELEFTPKQLEAVKQVASNQAPKINEPISAKKSTTDVDEKSELKNALQNIKQTRLNAQNNQADKNKDAPIKPPVHPYDEPAQTSSQSEVSRQIIDDVRSELHSLKELLMSNATTQLSSMVGFTWKKHAPQNAAQGKIWQRLEHMGFDDWIIYQLVQKIKDGDEDKKVWQQVLQDLALHIAIAPSDKLKRGGVFALVGPTGAGKTTTIAKMAVRYVMEQDDPHVGLITMDNYRLAAHDQLRTLGQILGVPVSVADQDHTLEHCLNELSECDLVLIDTAGLTPQHPMLSYQLQQIQGLSKRIHTLLTLPATSHSRVLRKVYHSYKAAGLSGCVLTKMDEASSLGEAITALIEADLPLSYITDGQRIPDDFHTASAKALVKQTVQVAQQEQMAADTTTLVASSW